MAPVEMLPTDAMSFLDIPRLDHDAFHPNTRAIPAFNTSSLL
jgi:hypothetical protein